MHSELRSSEGSAERDTGISCLGSRVLLVARKIWGIPNSLKIARGGGQSVRRGGSERVEDRPSRTAPASSPPFPRVHVQPSPLQSRTKSEASTPSWPYPARPRRCALQWLLHRAAALFPQIPGLPPMHPPFTSRDIRHGHEHPPTRDMAPHQGRYPALRHAHARLLLPGCA